MFDILSACKYENILIHFSYISSTRDFKFAINSTPSFSKTTISNVVIAKFEYPTKLDRATVLMKNTKEKNLSSFIVPEFGKNHFFPIKRKIKIRWFWILLSVKIH